MTDSNNILRSSCTVAKQHCSCFDKLNPDQLEMVEGKQVEVLYKKGEIIAKQGSFSNQIMFVCDGLVKIFIEDQSAKLILKIIPSGNLIGLTSLSDENTVFPYTAMAYQDTTVRLIDKSVFKRLIRENGEFAAHIITILGENSQQINGRFFCLTNKQSYGRLADILLCLANRIFKSEQFDLHLTRKELAELAGMSTENVIRILKKFQDDNLIRIEGKALQILDFEGLQRISEHG
jgi:CRP/FNR family transcriptional regulator